MIARSAAIYGPTSDAVACILAGRLVIVCNGRMYTRALLTYIRTGGGRRTVQRSNGDVLVCVSRSLTSTDQLGAHIQPSS